jgi:hypothetical protein
MSRSGYVEDDDGDTPTVLWRTAVNRSIWGKRGQAFLREMATALDSMPGRKLVTGELVNGHGEACAIGSVAIARGLDVSGLDPWDGEAVAAAFGIAPALAREIAYLNDESGHHNETAAARWDRMRAWVRDHIGAESEGDPKGADR